MSMVLAYPITSARNVAMFSTVRGRFLRMLKLALDVIWIVRVFLPMLQPADNLIHFEIADLSVASTRLRP
jgi:hypothetical protein